MMKKITWLFLVFLVFLTLVSCMTNDSEDEKEDDKIEENNDQFLEEIPIDLYSLYAYNFYYDYCCYLPAYSSLSVDGYTNAIHGKIYDKLRSDSNYRYKDVAIDKNLSEWVFALTYNSRINKDEIIKRYDVYKDNEFINKSYFIDNDKNIYIMDLVKDNNEDAYTIKLGFCIKPYFLLPSEINRIIVETAFEQKITKEEFVSAIPKMEKIFQEIKLQGSYSTKIASLTNLLPFSKCVFFGSGLFFEHYLVGDNLIFSIYGYNKEISMQLVYYTNNNLVLVCDNPNEFQDFINNYYNDCYYGVFYLGSSKESYINIPIIMNNSTPKVFEANLFTSGDSKKITGTYIKENGILILNPEKTATLLSFQLENGYLRFINQNIVNDGIYPIDVEENEIFSKKLESNLEGLDNILAKLNKDNVSSIYGIYSMLSSYIWNTGNESLISYITEKLKKINFIDELTNANMEEESKYGNRYLVFDLKDGNKIILELTNNGYLYLKYHEVGADNKPIIKSQFKSDLSEFYYFFTQFMGMGAPVNEKAYFKNEVIDKYYDDPSLSRLDEEFIIRNYINMFAELALYYKEGYKFSGSIKNYYGKYNNYYAVMVEGAGIEFINSQTSETIADITFNYKDDNRIYLALTKFYTLQEAFDQNIITYDDLLKIKYQHELDNRMGKIFFSSSKNNHLYINNKTDELTEIQSYQIFKVIDSLAWAKVFEKNKEEKIEYTRPSCFRISSHREIEKDDNNLMVHFASENVLLCYDIYLDSGIVIMSYPVMSSIINDLYAYLSQDDIKYIKEIFNINN